jgi:hypothetical protein
MFLNIVKDIKKVNKLEHSPGIDFPGSQLVAIDLLVLGALRVVASGCAFDLVEEATCVSEEKHRLFFHEQFCKWGDRISSDWIYMPVEEEELRKVMYVYEKKGIPGCAGSIDCVHLIWDKCPAGMHSTCKGKGSYPTLAFQVIASHTRKILSVSQYFWGTINDKTIAMSDETVNSFRRKGPSGSSHADRRWRTSHSTASINSINQTSDNIVYFRTVNDNVVLAEHRGLYFICDGGYNTFPCLICPYKHQPPGTNIEKWSKQIESVRKDVECTFGILKKRFLILKHALRIHDPQKIERVFVTCCVLHNMLLEYDGLDDKWIEDDEDIMPEYGIFEEAAEERTSRRRRNVGAVSGVRSARREEYGVRESEDDDDEWVLSGESDHVSFQERREHLISHYNRMLNKGTVMF